MRTVVVVGAGIAGLGAALALSRQGWRVILCERDPAPVPAQLEERWSAWPRPGTPQAHHPHMFGPLLRRVLRERAPDVLQCLHEAGATMLDFSAGLSRGERLPEDADLAGLLCRRPVMEGILRRIVEADPLVEVRPGCRVAGLLAEPARADGVPWVVGVRTQEGAPIVADGVVIAGGRRLPLAAWLAAIGAGALQEVVEDCGVVYYTRYFRLLSPDGTPPAMEPLLISGDLGYMSFGMMGSDSGAFHMLLAPAASDAPLHVLHEERAFMAVLHSVPSLAPWLALERSTPIGRVEAMGRLNNLLRRFVIDGRPLAAGLYVIGDARCHTDPSFGWGASLAMAQAGALADVLAEHPANPHAAALAFDARVGDDLARWHHVAVTADRVRTRRWLAASASAHAEAASSLPDDDPEQVIRTVVGPAAAEDPHVFRAYTRRWHLLDPPAALPQNTAVLERAHALAAARRPPVEPPACLGPTRDEVRQIIAAAQQGRRAPSPIVS